MLDFCTHLLASVGAVGRLTAEAIPKDEDTTCERLRVNLIHETHGFFRAVDQLQQVHLALHEVPGVDVVGQQRLLESFFVHVQRSLAIFS